LTAIAGNLAGLYDRDGCELFPSVARSAASERKRPADQAKIKER